MSGAFKLQHLRRAPILARCLAPCSPPMLVSRQSSRCRPAPSRQATSDYAEHLPPATYLCTYIHTYRARGRLQRIDGLVRCGLAPIEWRRPYASVLPETSVRKSNPKLSKAFEGHSRNIAPEPDHEALKCWMRCEDSPTVCVCAVAGLHVRTPDAATLSPRMITPVRCRVRRICVTSTVNWSSDSRTEPEPEPGPPCPYGQVSTGCTARPIATGGRAVQ